MIQRDAGATFIAPRGQSLPYCISRRIPVRKNSSFGQGEKTSPYRRAVHVIQLAKRIHDVLIAGRRPPEREGAMPLIAPGYSSAVDSGPNTEILKHEKSFTQRGGQLFEKGRASRI